jgi:hypothetical protein
MERASAVDGDNRSLRDRSSYLVTPAFKGHVDIRVTHVVPHKLRPYVFPQPCGWNAWCGSLVRE